MVAKKLINQTNIIDILISSNFNQDETIKLIEELQFLYNQPARHYHNFGHIIQVIDFLYKNLEHINNPRVIFWAALFHDIIYDTHSNFSQNENESAKFAENELSGKLPNEELEKVSLYIKATSNHNNNLQDSDLSLFFDADIAILGAGNEIYKKYSDNIRKEYSWVPDSLYIEARIKILRNFLDRERFYTTDLAHYLFEAQARTNMLNEIDYLNKQ